MLLTTKEMAKQLGIHPETLRRKVRKGEVQVAYKVGETDYRFNPDDVMEALNVKNVPRKTDI